jgi:hypothetical protein
MATIEIRGVESVRALLASLGGELDEASRLAQNKMAYELWAAEKDQIKSDLDRPAPWSVNALRYKKAGDAASLGDAPNVPGAAVYMANAFRAGSRVGPDEWLGVQIKGGVTAGPRRSERILQNAGILPRDTVWVPARGVGLDAYGNLKGGVIARMLMDLGQNPYARTRTKNFALIGPRGNPVGVITKVGDSWYPFLFFVPRATYRARYDFYGRADREVAARFADIWNEYLAQALAHLA